MVIRKKGQAEAAVAMLFCVRTFFALGSKY